MESVEMRKPGPRGWGRIGAACLVAVALLLSAVPGRAAAEDASRPDISKSLDATQGSGFTSPNTFTVGSLVRYNLEVSCSSLKTTCDVGTVTDTLDDDLEFKEVIKPTGGSVPPITVAAVGQDVTVTVGPDFAGGTTLELVLVAKVRPSAAGKTIPNQANITITNLESKDSEVVEIVVPTPTPKWTLEKYQQQPSGNKVAVGSEALYRIDLVSPEYDNLDIKAGTKLVDTYPAGATVVDADGGVVDEANHTITWTITDPIKVAGINCASSHICKIENWRQVTLIYSSPTFDEGDDVTNNAKAEVTYSDNTTGELTASAPTHLTDLKELTLTKTGPTSVSAGQPIRWELRATNVGTATLTNVAVVDDLPAGLAEVKFAVNSYVQPANSALAPVSFDAYVNDAWVTFAKWVPDPGNPGAAKFEEVIPGTRGENKDHHLTLAAPAGATKIRMVGSRLRGGDYFSIDVEAVIPADTEVDTKFNNCATIDSDGNPTVPAEQCVEALVESPFVMIQTMKFHEFSDKTHTSAIPGEEFLWGLGMLVTGGASVDKINVADVLPKQFEYIDTACYTRSGSGGGLRASWDDGRPADLADCAAAPQPSVQSQPDGQTRLSWVDLPITIDSTTPGAGGGVYWLTIRVRVKPKTSVATYTNSLYAETDQAVTKCKGTEVADSDDLDSDGDSTEATCIATDDVQVRLAAVAQVTKWDRGPQPNVAEATGQPDSTCPDWEGFTRFPCVAQTIPGGDFDYRFRIENVGNIDMTDFVAYDILPGAGDTGVTQTLAGQARDTDWVPVLTGPVTVENEPAAAQTSIEYNLTANPCRPELASGANDVDWQGGSCDSTWLSASQVTDWSQVKSFRVHAFPEVSGVHAEWEVGDEIILAAAMKAPEDAKLSVKDPLHLSVAWNSIGHREYRLNSDNSTLRLLAAEPRKVGVIVPFPGVSVGDWVWLDLNRDGLQTAGEPPVEGVVVTLRNAAGDQVATTKTDADGYYAFRFLNPSTPYTIEFTPPAGHKFTTVNSGGDTSNSATADLTDSDADPVTGQVSFTSPASGANLGDPRMADNPGLDAGFVTDQDHPVSIGDYVWWDNDRDGTQDDNEPAVPGVKVNLLDKAGHQIATTVTDSKGYYYFKDLAANTAYVVEFVKPASTSFTVANQGPDRADSDADVVTGRVSVTTPARGDNQVKPDKADDPTIDAGLVKLNLTLTKSLVGSAMVKPGGTVKFVLVPHNDGPSAALAGWTVTDLLPDGLELVSMTGKGYTCVASTCTAAAALAGGKDGAPITVAARVSDSVTSGRLQNVAYVAPAPGEVPETNPLEVPTTDTDTTTTSTDNDAEAAVELAQPGLALAKSGTLVDANHNGRTDVGDLIRYQFRVTNTGNVAIAKAVVTDRMLADAGIGITCPATGIEVGDSVVCTANAGYQITKADVAAGKVTNSATVSGDTPDQVVADAEDTVDTDLTDLPLTGAGLAVAGIGAVILAAGGVLLFVARRRRGAYLARRTV